MKNIKQYIKDYLLIYLFIYLAISFSLLIYSYLIFSNDPVDIEWTILDVLVMSLFFSLIPSIATFIAKCLFSAKTNKVNFIIFLFLISFIYVLLDFTDNPNIALFQGLSFIYYFIVSCLYFVFPKIKSYFSR